MVTLDRLAIRHAELSSEVTAKKAQIISELAHCNGGEYVKPESESYVDFSFLLLSNYLEQPNCLQMTYEAFAEFNNSQYEHYGYDELLFNYGCEHCQSARSLKKQIGKIRQERGRIHSALTNIGKSLIKGSK